MREQTIQDNQVDRLERSDVFEHETKALAERTRWSGLAGLRGGMQILFTMTCILAAAQSVSAVDCPQ
jgi:hypothetical protein